MDYYLFVLTALAAAVLPGADFAVVTKNTLALGRAGGQATAFGVGAGLLIHTTAATLGLSVIIVQSAYAFEIVKYAGAIYLFYIGVEALRSAKSAQAMLIAADEAASKSNFFSCFRQGVLTNALNPKASIFYLTLLPQFINPAADSLPQLAGLGLTAVLIVTVWFLLLAYTLNHVRRYFENAAFQANFQRLTGTLLITFGIKLALMRE